MFVHEKGLMLHDPVWHLSSELRSRNSSPHNMRKFKKQLVIITPLLLFIVGCLVWKNNSTKPTSSTISRIELPPSTPEVHEVKKIKETKNVVVMIVSPPFDVLVPSMLHTASVLGSDWSMKIFTTEFYRIVSSPLERLIEEGKVSIHRLPQEVEFSNEFGRSKFMTQPWLWEFLAPAEHVLYLQGNSILCSNSPQKVEDFLEYDFIGPPMDQSLGRGDYFSGGLSLRRRSMMLDIVKASSWEGEAVPKASDKNHSMLLEDQWFYIKMKELPRARLPTFEVASGFAVESMWHNSPLAYHNVQARFSMRMNTVYEWCPEYRLISSHLLGQQKVEAHDT